MVRVEDLLNASRSNALDNLMGDMVQTMHQQQLQQQVSGNGDALEGVWYSVPVSLDSSQHLCSDESWNGLLQRIQTRVQDAASTACKCCALRQRGCSECTDKMCSCDCRSQDGGRREQCTCKCCDANMWHCEILPASKIFVVRSVLKEENKWSQRLHPVNNRDHHLCWESDRNLPIMDPIYHLYVQCKPKAAAIRSDLQEQSFPGDGIAGPNLCFMDTMYNRWAVQNPVQLRQRILERKAQELGVPLERACMPQRQKHVHDAAASRGGIIRLQQQQKKQWTPKRMGEDIENSENVLGRRGTKTTRALHSLRKN